MKLSIFTDASVNPHTKMAGYAFYIGCRLGKIQKAGKLKIVTTKSHVAELHCIANAVYTLLHSKFTPVTQVFIYSDSLICINALKPGGSFLQPEDRIVLEEIKLLMMEVCLKHGKPIRSVNTFFKINHVKAHTFSTDKLSVINDWCDKNAKKYTVKKK